MNKEIKDKLRFYIILTGELLFFPLLHIFEFSKRYLGSRKSKNRYRLPVDKLSPIRIVVHEWGGYSLVRQKKIKHGKTFYCGLESQLNRYKDSARVELTVTISDSHLSDSIEKIKHSGASILPVSNAGYDFSGYEAFYEQIKDQGNGYVILSNSSVNADISDYLDGYIAYMEKNKDVGMLGVSYCTKRVQSLIRPNFTPHLQSFFLLTTTSVLREMVALNKGKFPGKGITHKLLLIREGEIRISKLVERLGYRLAVVNPLDSNPYKFEDYHNWKLPFGDIRQKTQFPNRITPIAND